MNPYFNESIT